jgi:hypothetical protein
LGSRMLQGGFTLRAVGIAVGLFIAMMLFLEIGRRLGLRQFRKRGSEARVGVGVVDASVYSLFALLVGFSFSGAAERFNERRLYIADEVNVAGTGWRRIDLLPAERQPVVREGFRNFADALIRWYSQVPRSKEPIHQPASLTSAQDDLWSRAVNACLSPGGEPARMLLLPALTDLFGVVEKERMARRIHPPLVIFAMLGIAALATALFAGYGLAVGAKRNWIYMIGISASVAMAVYVIIELEYPRLGLFRVDAMDQTLVELRATME